MLEQIEARIKMALFLALFSLPIIAGMWSRHLDNQIARNRYLPPLAPMNEMMP